MRQVGHHGQWTVPGDGDGDDDYNDDDDDDDDDGRVWPSWSMGSSR